MTRTGIDTAVAPAPSVVKAMLAAIGASWILVYIGGPRNGGSGWGPDYINSLVASGVQYFLPCWVGWQVVPGLGLNDTGHLTAAQGYTDGQNAVARMEAYQWGPGCPVALDVEYDTAQRATAQAVAYSDGWCKAVRDAGYVPGVYAPLFFLERLWQETNKPSFAYAADWIRSAVDHGLSPEQIPGLPAEVAHGARVWQYAGDSSVLGQAADIDVADIPLAPAPGTVPVKPPPTPAAHTPEQYAAASWVHAVQQLTLDRPVAQCPEVKQLVRAWVAAHP